MGNLKLQLFAKSIEELAKETIRGNYGNGEDRKKALGSNYSEVQKVVNQMLNGTYKPASTNTNKNNSNANKTPKANNTPAANNKNVPKVNGVDSSLMETINSTFTPDADTKKLEGNVTNSANAYKDWASNTDIIDQSTLDALNKQWQTPASVLEADKFLAGQLEQIRSGRTSYTDQVESLFNKYMNREDFEYDVSEDQLFQQALASAMGSGKAAMQDTIGQASALTGGYGSTYATSAGNQAYNSFIEDAYNNLPEYYNMALQAYQMEGDEMLQQFNMAATLDAQEYGRLVDSYNAGVDARNWDYNTAFNEYTTGVTNAYNSANLQLQQNAQIGSNLYNTYLVEKDAYETKYNQSYQTWLDSVNSAVNIAGMQNKDYWSKTEFDEKVRQYDEQFAYQKERDKVADYHWQQDYNLASVKADNTAEIEALEQKYGNHINPDDIEVDPATGEIINIKGYKMSGTTPGTTTNIGNISGFKTKEGDNFKVEVAGKSYKVENDGKVTDATTKNKLNGQNVQDGQVCIVDGKMYAKKDDEYYKIRNRNIFTKGDYEDLYGALTTTKK